MRNHYNELTVNFKEKNGRRMDVVFRVFDDGVGFRYILPSQKGEKFVIQDELTEITLAHDAKGLVNSYQSHRLFRRHLYF